MVVVGSENMVRWILVPSLIEYPVAKELVRTFNDDVVNRIVRLTETVITNYASKRQVEAVKKEMKERFDKWLREEYNDGDEVYVILGGSNLNVSEAIILLERSGVPYKRLIYEKKVGRYVVV